MSVTFAQRLARFGSRSALVLPTTSRSGRESSTVTYGDLADLIAARSALFSRGRRLILLELLPELEPVVTYLAALASGQVVILAPIGAPAAVERLQAVYDPDVVAATADGAWRLQEHRPATLHDLHAELALLLGTSGSSGSPKLVRLSASNVVSNARSVAGALALRPDDRAVTVLPLSYCYGLSVLHSHLAVGASVVLSPWSVLEQEFWAAVQEHGVTNFAGVPHTFDLLERSGSHSRYPSSLRLVTQAGGAMASDRVREWAALGARQGWSFVPMYGQTEATARIACMPRGLAGVRPEAVGLPVPGGSLRILTSPEGESDVDAAVGQVGQIVYAGPNVMLGYAHGPADLALGRTTYRLRTGDRGYLGPDGLLRVTGRDSALVKIAGMRVDLHQVDADLADLGIRALASGADGRLDVAVECCAHPSMVRGLLASELSLPPSAVRVVAVDELPVTANGKPDRSAVSALVDAGVTSATCCATGCAGAPESERLGVARAECGTSDATAEAVRPGPATSSSRATDDADRGPRLVALYADVLARPDADEGSSFISLGGDSLSFVELSVRLEQELGTVPDDWQTLPIHELTQVPGRRARWARADTAVVLRCWAIVAIVGTHANLFTVRGGAHLLLAVAGFNAARFTFARGVGDHAGRLLRTVARMAAPTVLWVAGLAALGLYPWTTAMLMNSLAGPDAWGRAWHYWFVEALVWILVGTGLLLSVPAVRRQREAYPFGFAVALVSLGLLPRFDVVHVWTGPERGTPQYVFWLFGLGVAAAEARTTRQRILVSALSAVSVPGFFGSASREAVVLIGILALVWVQSLPVPRRLIPVVGAVAGASLYIYLVQWQIFPALRDIPIVALLTCLGAGVSAWAAVNRAQRALRPRRSAAPTAMPSRALTHSQQGA